MHTSLSRLHLAAFALVAGSALIFGLPAAAHSNGMEQMDMDGGASRQDSAGFRFGAPASDAQATRTLKIAMTDMSFEPSKVTVRTGEIVRFVVTNMSGIDHEFTLGDAAPEQAHRKEMVEVMAEGEGVEHDDPNAITVKAGESGANLEIQPHRGVRLRLQRPWPLRGGYEGHRYGAVMLHAITAHATAWRGSS
jgi:uncharacterized cupredoxin-like copper-binding protein